MQPSKGFVVRLAIYSFALFYLAGDLLLLKGPLYQRLLQTRPDSGKSLAAFRARGAVARVYHHPILRAQLDRAVAERLWLEGKTATDLDPRQLKLVRYAVLNDLIDHQLLRVKVKANGAEFPVSEAEIDAAVERFRARFSSREELDQALKHEGIDTEQEFRFRLAAGIQRGKYLESRLAGAFEVGEQEAREWFYEHAKSLARPERLRVRHVFVATLERDPAEAKAVLTEALGKLERKEQEFARLAAELSEDEASKTRGGDLGWISRERLPADFTAPLFKLATAKPALVRTKLGWHLAEVTDRKPAEARTFDEAKAEVVAALQAAKRRQAAAAFRAQLRKNAAAQINVFHDAME